MLRRLTLLVLPAALVGCSLFFHADDLGNDPSPPATPDATIGADAAGGEAAATSGCPSREGPVMVRIDDFCIDSTEVTRAQYAKFVAAVDAGAKPTTKANNCHILNRDVTPLDPEEAFPPRKEGPEHPVRLVDWCDAKAYCLWAGKDLCGGLGGKKLAPKEVSDPSKSQWAKACTENGTKRFAYGDGHIDGRCVEGTDPSRPHDGTCQGGYAGLFDMVGNVGEWIDACEDDVARCPLAGLAPSREISSCTWVDMPPLDIPWNMAGIRCCAKAE